MSRTLEEAKEIVELGLKLGVHSWDDPNAVTDDAIMKRADDLVDAALQGSANNTVNEAALEVLHVARVAPISEVTREAYAQRFGVAPPAQTNGNAPEPSLISGETAQAMADATRRQAASAFGQLADGAHPSGEASAPAAGETLHERVNAIFGVEYDDLKATQIKAAIADSAASGDLTPEEWGVVKQYESETEQRKTILSFEPEFKAPEPDPVATIAAGAFSPPGDSRDTGHVASPGDADAPLEQVYSGDAQTRAQQEGLPIPAHVALDQAPIVPVNITDISDQELSALGAVFHSLFARAQWLISQEEGRAAAAEHLERETEHDAYVHAYSLHREQIPEEKRTQPTALEAARKQAEKDAETNDKVRVWRSRRVRHGVETRELKALANGYDKSVWRIDKELDRRARAATTARAAS